MALKSFDWAGGIYTRGEKDLKMKSPKVSIIILNWNGLEDTVECIESLNKITYPNYEVIVVDNASSGNDVEVLRQRFGDYIYIIENGRNYGFAEGNNIGMRYVLERGPDYVLLLNNDTTVAPDFLDKLMEVVQGNVRIGIAGPKSYHYDEPERLGCAGGFINYWTGSIRHMGAGQIDRGQLEQIINVDYITGTCMLISREVLVSVGLLDNRVFFSGGSDVDICIRASRRGFRALFAAKSKIWHKGESRVRLRASSTRKRAYCYDFIRGYFTLRREHWGKAQFITSSLCLIARLPLLFITYLRFYRGWDTLVAFWQGTLDYFIKKHT